VTPAMRERLGLDAADEAGGGEQNFDEIGEVVGEVAVDDWCELMRKRLIPNLVALVETKRAWVEIESWIRIKVKPPPAAPTVVNPSKIVAEARLRAGRSRSGAASSPFLEAVIHDLQSDAERDGRRIAIDIPAVRRQFVEACLHAPLR